MLSMMLKEKQSGGVDMGLRHIVIFLALHELLFSGKEDHHDKTHNSTGL